MKTDHQKKGKKSEDMTVVMKRALTKEENRNSRRDGDREKG